MITNGFGCIWFSLVRRAAICTAVTLSLVLPSAAVVRFQQTTRVEANQQTEFEIFLPLTHSPELSNLLRAQQTPGSPQFHKWLTPDQFAQRFGPDVNAIKQIADVVKAYGLQVLRMDAHGLRVRGTASAIEQLFQTSLWNGVGPHGAHQLIAASGHLTMPSAFVQARATVAAFSPVIRHQVHSRNVEIVGSPESMPQNRSSDHGPYWYTDIKQAYNFPSYQALSGKGVHIGILMASDYNEADMKAYFGHEKLSSPPKVICRLVDGGAPYDPDNNDATGEAALDLQQAGGMAPNATLYLYDVPDLSDGSIFDAWSEILQNNEVDIVNASFGASEALYGPDYNNGISYVAFLGVYEQLFAQANAQGISIVASSGDSGGLETPPVGILDAPSSPAAVVGYFLPGVSTPASSQYVTGVGGTNLLTTYDSSSSSQASQYVSENAFGDPEKPYDPYGTGNLIAGGYFGSGGGVSQYIPKPDYQTLVDTGSADYRTVPDIAFHMGGCPLGIAYPCPPGRSAVWAAVNGKFYGYIGTSVAAPEMAGLLALREELVPGRMGNANYFIYLRANRQFTGKTATKYYRTGIAGFNGYDQTHSGYNRVLGNGTISVRDFLGVHPLPPIGNPGSSSNP